MPRTSTFRKETRLWKTQQARDSLCQATLVTVFGEEWEEDWSLLKPSKHEMMGTVAPGLAGRVERSEWIREAVAI